jgi:mannose-6-phosphate isomerase-like protein (cupin superfamily)
MFNVSEYIDTGVLELYVLGIATAEECLQLEALALEHTEIRDEIEKIKLSVEVYASANSLQPNPVIKPFLMATIDYTERLKNGEPPAAPPMLSENASITDYSQWLSRPDMVSTDKEDVFAKIIGYTPEAITAIVWLKDYAPHEVHDNEYERFLIVEGTCDIIVEDEINQLVAGDYFAIPLHKKHMVKVTSAITCKVILQRVAA